MQIGGFGLKSKRLVAFYNKLNYKMEFQILKM